MKIRLPEEFRELYAKERGFDDWDNMRLHHDNEPFDIVFSKCMQAYAEYYHYEKEMERHLSSQLKE